MFLACICPDSDGCVNGCEVVVEMSVEVGVGRWDCGMGSDKICLKKAVGEEVK